MRRAHRLDSRNTLSLAVPGHLLLDDLPTYQAELMPSPNQRLGHLF